MADFENNSTTMSDFRNLRIIYEFSNSTSIFDIRLSNNICLQKQ